MNDLHSSQKAQNLARIRDNQRRSRARRKEYLQELEEKLRSCEQIGIAASSEIQNAARRVVDENRKLRALLHAKGVCEPEVVAALGGTPDRPYDQVSAVPRLNAMLDRKITTSALPTTSSPLPSHPRAVSIPRQRPSVPPIAIPQARSTAVSYSDSASPGSVISSTSTPPPVSYPATIYNTPITRATTEIKLEDTQYDYSYGEPYNNSWTYTGGYNYNPDSSMYYSRSSCVDAAHIIRTMRSNVGPELEADLGCRNTHQQCYVDTNTVFNVMDKYSTNHAAI